jgi:FtsH ternary system domain X3
MRVKVRFRFNSVTGEVEAFEVDDLRDGPRLADHDARHDRAAAEVARIVEVNALIEEVAPGAGPVTTATTRTPAATETPAGEPERNRE